MTRYGIKARIRKKLHRNSETVYLLGVLNMEFLTEKNSIRITDEIVASWQSLVNTMAEIIDVPAALIMKVDPPYIEVFRVSESSNNPYEAGDKEPLAGLYCEKVIKTKSRLLVPNALRDSQWDKNPDIKLGMISYLGFPLLWPDGEVFGTICVLDSRENQFQKHHEKLMIKFKELIEAHLALLYKGLADRKNLEGILDNLAEGIIVHDKDRRILFFNRAAEKTTGYSREDVLRKDCHDVFGGPFCGSQELCRDHRAGPKDAPGLWPDTRPWH
jgi:PAS domain-containing protein